MFTNDTLYFKTIKIEKLKNVLPLIESMCDCITTNSNTKIKITGYSIIEKENIYDTALNHITNTLKTSEKRLSFTNEVDCSKNGYIPFPAPMCIDDLYDIIKSWYENEPLNCKCFGDGDAIKALEIHSVGECCTFDELHLNEVFYVKIGSVYISK